MGYWIKHPDTGLSMHEIRYYNVSCVIDIIPIVRNVLILLCDFANI